MPNTSNAGEDSDLPPPGSRWGAGAGSVLPYLTRSLQAKPAGGAETREARMGEELQLPAEQRPTASA